MEYFGLKLGQDLGNRAAHPYQEFRGVPPLRDRDPYTKHRPLCALHLEYNHGEIFQGHAGWQSDAGHSRKAQNLH